MSTWPDFPTNCSTNTHILHDFAEIAYIVCTHAAPAGTESAADVNSPERILERLRNAEKQFRQHSILVALDTEKLELFTFYRKVDVVHDQRTILNKFGYVCRLNSCIISAKSATRVLDLLKPESSRIYRLFTAAVVASIEILPRGGESVVAIGRRVYLVPAVEQDDSQYRREAALYPGWQICRVNVQIVPSGQLILTVQYAKSTIFTQLSDLEDERGARAPPPGSLLYLAPTGQIARFVGGCVGSKRELIEKAELITQSAKDQTKIAIAQIAVATSWFKQKHPDSAPKLDEFTRWIAIEIAVVETTRDTAKNPPAEVVWKSLMWPSTMVYVFKTLGQVQTPARRNASETDPLNFVLEWLNGSAERKAQSARAQAPKDDDDTWDDANVFGDEVRFEDNYHPQTFGPPAFPASQMVYPTPPEAMITHQTPGMSSADGLAPTPAPVVQLTQPDSEFLEQEMSEAPDHHPDPVGTGFYDEDLFEEMPDDKFAATADIKESDWDFFDQPGIEDHTHKVGPSHHGSGEKKANSDFKLTTPGIDLHATDFSALEASNAPRADMNFPNDIGLTVPISDKLDGVYDEDLTLSPMNLHQSPETTYPPPVYNSKRLSNNEHNQTAVNMDDQHDMDARAHHTQPLRRSSSVFDGVTVRSDSRDHDVRYDKRGKFWFDSEPLNRLAGKNLPYYNAKKRPASPDSDMSLTSSTSSSNADSASNVQDQTSSKRTWTEYHRESPGRELEQMDGGVDLTDVPTDTAKLLAVIGAASGEDPFLVQIERIETSHRRPTYTPQKTLMVAQILVDQMSQSSLLRQERIMELHRAERYRQVDLSMEHSGVKTLIGRATLADLSSSPPRVTSRIINLKSRLVCIHRADDEILARQSILPFWDLLGLQPYSASKNITAFCIHPSSGNVADGCSVFLSRLGDTYVACNLGVHATGRVAGLTNNGLLAWSSQSGTGPNLKQLCQRLGSAMGSNGTTLHGTVVVYMMSPFKDAICYRDICHAFTILFETFADTSGGMKRNTELVLQIVPLDFVASPDTLVVPSQEAFLELALEVYNRVPLERSDTSVTSCGSAVILERNQLREPAFELSNVAGSPLSKDGSCLHFAYSYSSDKRWLTAAWSDERGLIAFTMSYCLAATSGGKTHSKREVFRHIWDTSFEVMHRTRSKWRLVIAHAGSVESDDLSEWQQLVSQSTDDRKWMTRLIMLSVDLNPDIVVEVPGAVTKVSHQPTISQAPNVSGTPVSTPQTGITSPDQMVAATPASGGMSHANAATPPDHHLDAGHETETLIDPADQSWGVLLAYGRTQFPNTADSRIAAAAAASGLLVKRTGSKNESKMLRLLGINLLSTPRSQSSALTMAERESILQEMMDQYRALITLAVSRGCIDRSFDCVPWHVATVVKGSRALSEAM